MKKYITIRALIACVIGLPTMAAEPSAELAEAVSLSQKLIDYADTAIANGKISVDTLLSTMQTIHQHQQSVLAEAVQNASTQEVVEVYNQWGEMYPLTTHLYALKAGSGVQITNASGVIYSFKMLAPMKWMNLSRGDTNYYAFPKKDTFVELQFSLQTGMLYNETSIEDKGTTIKPTYYYGGENTLNNLSWKDLGMRIMEIKNKNADQYLFFDLPKLATGDLQRLSLSVMSGGSVSGSSIYEAISYSPEYFLTSLDQGFQFCQKVSAFVGATSTTKEYSAQECNDAAKGVFYSTMHEDILAYAVDQYL
jgi:hypothetical protein